MRKYLWALALCGAAGMAVPSWAQERSKSLFGLGRSKPATAPSKEAAKSSKLRNYGELFGEKQPPAAAPNAEAPSPESVRQMMDEAKEESVSGDSSESLAPVEKGTPKAAANTKTMTVRKAPVIAKTSLLDDSEELDRLEALDEIEETQEHAKAITKSAPAKTIIRPAPPVAPEARVVVRPPVKAAPPVKTASSDKPAWATEAAREEDLAADFEPTPPKKPAPPVKPVRTESAVVSRPTAKPPVAKTPVAKPAVVRTTKSRLGTPISVVSEPEEVAASGTLTQASATEPEAPAPAPVAAPPARSRLTVTRSMTIAWARVRLARRDAQAEETVRSRGDRAVERHPSGPEGRRRFHRANRVVCVGEEREGHTHIPGEIEGKLCGCGARGGVVVARAADVFDECGDAVAIEIGKR